MTYNRPEDVTYTQMAMWIDDNAYSETCDESTLYEYLYHLSNMLAHQSAYFNSAEDYDQFSLYSASRLFLRLKNTKQFEYTHNQPKMKQIKSILNYLKKVLYPYKVDFELEFRIEKNVDVINIGTFDIGSHIVENASMFDTFEFSFVVGDLSKVVKAHLLKIPKKKNSSEWVNIYISCMLSLLDSITLSNQILKKYQVETIDKFETIEKLYSELRYKEPILFHLPESMSTYIRVLVNEIRHVLAAEISWKGDTYIPADVSMKNLICNALDLED